MSDFNANNNGLTQKLRKEFREKILTTSIDKLVNVTEKYLMGSPSRSVLSSKKFEKQLSSLGFKINSI